jgi:outer membrane immunogenic protein
MLSKTGIVVALLLLFISLGLAQDNRYDVSLGGAGVFSKQSTGNGTIQTPTQSGAFLAIARLRFSPRSSVEVNYARTRNSQNYLSGLNNYRIQGVINEFTGAYVFSFHQSEHLEPFVFAGGGILVFNPITTLVDTVLTNLGATRQTKPAFLYGAGVDYKVFSILPVFSRSPHAANVALRLQYRGLLYKAPGFGVPNLFTGARGHMAEPAIGLVVKF